MLSDSDFLEDIFSQPTQETDRALGKFQPKVKKKPRRPTPLPSIASDASESVPYKNGDLGPDQEESGKEAEIMCSSLNYLDNTLLDTPSSAVQSGNQSKTLESLSPPHEPSGGLEHVSPPGDPLCHASQPALKEESLNHLLSGAKSVECDRNSDDSFRRSRAEDTTIPSDLEPSVNAASQTSSSSVNPLSSFASIVPSEGTRFLSSRLIDGNKEHATSAEAPLLDIADAQDNVALDTDGGKSGEEVADIFSITEPTDDFVTQPTVSAVRAVKKFQPKDNKQPKTKKLLKHAPAIPDDTKSNETSIRDSCIPANGPSIIEETEVPQAMPSELESLDNDISHHTSTMDTSSHEDSHFFCPPNDGYEGLPSGSSLMDSSNFLITEDNAHNTVQEEFILSNCNRESVEEHGRLDGEEASVFSGLESLDDILDQPLSSIARGVGKYCPKPRSRNKNVQAVGSISSSKDSQHPKSENLKGPSLAFQSEFQVDSSTRLHCDTRPCVSSPQSPTNHELELPNLERISSTHPEEITKGDHFQNELPSQRVIDKDTILKTAKEGPGISRQLRKRIAVHSPIHDSEDANLEDLGTSNTSQMDEDANFDNDDDDDDDDDEYTGEEMPRKKKVVQRPKCLSQENEKPVRKRKKASDGSDSTKQESPKKKFLHSTRRNRRRVDKVLLETPEDEIDERKLRMKDLILLAEARERMSIKQGATQKQSNAGISSSHEDYRYDEESAYAEGQDLNLDGDDGPNPEVKLSSTKLNYHTYMSKPLTVRWSKLDTELFYQAVRQFGSDFTMIQQLFPNRTRHQVKLKFKNEERKHPLQIADALVHRSKDHSQFELVIRQLQSQAAQNADKDIMDDEPPSESQHEAAENEYEKMGKSELGEDCDANDFDPNHSSMKYDDSQDDFDWSQFGNDDSAFVGKDEYDGY